MSLTIHFHKKEKPIRDSEAESINTRSSCPAVSFVPSLVSAIAETTSSPDDVLLFLVSFSPKISLLFSSSFQILFSF